MRERSGIKFLALLCATVTLLLLAIPWLRVLLDSDRPSKSIGQPSSGRLEHGHVLPPWGSGYRTYSLIGASLGRQYMHGNVRDTLLDAFAQRAREVKGLDHVVGESAVRTGGPFRGHRTHQNGLSVDIFMPVRDRLGMRLPIPTWPWNTFGYDHEFDSRGETSSLTIDFEELALLLIALDRSAAEHGVSIERVIITPEFVPLLLNTYSGKQLGKLAERLTRKPVWIRHDEHFHVDFLVGKKERAVSLGR